jgi:hypothetical protein
MTDPRITDDPRLRVRPEDRMEIDPVLTRPDENVGGMWGLIAGVSVLLLIGFLIFAGHNSNSNTASSGSSTSTTASPITAAPSTTGSGSSSFTPAPSTPAQSKSGTQ